ncbi:hypothetical protein GCM10009634_26230 [Saccharothrix xinjiangensis]
MQVTGEDAVTAGRQVRAPHRAGPQPQDHGLTDRRHPVNALDDTEQAGDLTDLLGGKLFGPAQLHAKNLYGRRPPGSRTHRAPEHRAHRTTRRAADYQAAEFAATGSWPSNTTSGSARRALPGRGGRTNL